MVRSTFSKEQLHEPQHSYGRTTMVSERGPVHFGDPGRVKRQAAPGHTASWTVWFFTEKSKATRAGRSGGTAGITGLVSQGGSADTRGEA